MNIERKIAFVQSMVTVCLLLNLALSGAMLVQLFKNGDSTLYGQKVFQGLLVIVFLTIVILIAVQFLFRTLHREPLRDKLFVDELTGFLTRQDFVQIFEHIVLKSSRDDEPLCLLMIDIDNFRAVNEKYGQQAGDQILTLLSKSIQSVLRTSDVNCRWAGDQFLVALKDCTIKDACRIAAKILITVRQQQLILEERIIKVTTSIGVAQMVKDDGPKNLIARAETGLHNACDNGRDTYAIGYDWIILEYYSQPIF